MTNKYLPWLNVAKISELPLDILVELADEANLESFSWCDWDIELRRKAIYTNLKIRVALDVVQEWLLEKSVYGGDTRYIFG